MHTHTFLWKGYVMLCWLNQRNGQGWAGLGWAWWVRVGGSLPACLSWLNDALVWALKDSMSLPICQIDLILQYCLKERVNYWLGLHLSIFASLGWLVCTPPCRLFIQTKFHPSCTLPSNPLPMGSLPLVEI